MSPFFLGNNQHQQFGKLKCLQEHKDNFQALSYQYKDLSSYSIKKGAISYLASLVGGPPVAATCICIGWTIGKFQNIYTVCCFRHCGKVSNTPSNYVSKIWCFSSIFSSILGKLGFGSGRSSSPHAIFCDSPSLTCYDVYSLTLIAKELCDHKIQLNHVVRSSHLFQNASILRHVQYDDNVIVVTYPWKDTTHCFSSIQPHIILLWLMEQAHQQQEMLMNIFVDKM